MRVPYPRRKGRKNGSPEAELARRHFHFIWQDLGEGGEGRGNTQSASWKGLRLGGKARRPMGHWKVW